MIDHHVTLIFCIFLLSLSSIASSGFHPIFTIDSMQKCEHKVKGKRFSFWSKESFLFLSYFLKLGIWLWTERVCLCISNISFLLLTCLCSWVLLLITQVLNLLVVNLCEPFIHKLKILGGGKLEYCESMEKTTKRCGAKFWNISVGKERVGHDFWLKFSRRGEILEDTMFLCFYLSFLVSIFFYSVIYVTNFFNVKVLRVSALEKNSFISERTFLWLPEAATGGVLQERCS